MSRKEGGPYKLKREQRGDRTEYALTVPPSIAEKYPPGQRFDLVEWVSTIGPNHLVFKPVR